MNLRNHLRQIALGSFETIQNSLKNADSKKNIQRDSFKSALAGISSGIMKYEHDPLLPMLQDEM